MGAKVQTVGIFKLTIQPKPPRIPRMDHTEYLKEIGRRGGQVKSKAKAQAARANGAKGGRPRIRTSTDKIIVASQAARV